MTNLENIQTMDAGEMASFLNKISMYCGTCTGCDKCPIGECRELDFDYECHFFSIKKWLESEAD